MSTGALPLTADDLVREITRGREADDEVTKDRSGPRAPLTRIGFLRNCRKRLVPGEGFEPPTFGLQIGSEWILSVSLR